MELLISNLMTIMAWLIPRKKLFSGLPLWGQGYKIKSAAEKDPAKAVKMSRALMEEELRLAVSRGTFDQPGTWDNNLAKLLQEKLIDKDTKEAIHKLLYGSRQCDSTKEALEYWYKVKNYLSRIKAIPRKTHQ